LEPARTHDWRRRGNESAQTQGANKVEQSLIVARRWKAFAGEPSVQSVGAHAEVPGSATRKIMHFKNSRSNYRSISTSNPGAPRAASTAMHQVVLAFGRFSEFDKFANVSFRTTGSNVNTGPASSFFGMIAFSGFGDLTQSAKSLTAPEPVLSDFTINHLNRT